jgi:hypothetical protein
MENNALVEAAAITVRQQVFAMFASKCLYAQAVCLREIHETKAYQKLGLTWDDYCTRHAGVSRPHAESIIKRLEEFGEAYFRLCALVRVSPDLFRDIRFWKHDSVTAETIELDGEQIPLVPENTQKIRAGINRLREEVRRLSNQFRVPTRVVEFGIREDDLLNAVTARARLGRALPNDEAAALRSLARHAANKWTEVVEMLRPDDNSSH